MPEAGAGQSLPGYPGSLTTRTIRDNFYLMKLLRLLANALLSGLFFSLLLTLLFIDLNINLKPSLFQMIGLMLPVCLFCGLPAVLLTIFVTYFIWFLSGKPKRLAWISPSFLSLSFASWLVPYLAVFRANQTYFSAFFDEEMTSLLRTQAIVLIALAVLGCLAFYAARRSGQRALFLYPIFYS